MTELIGRSLHVALQSRRRLVRDALTSVLASQQDLAVVGQTADIADLPALCALRSPDVVLIEAEGLTVTELETLSALHKEFPRVELVIVYADLPPRILDMAWRLGITTLLPSSRGLEALLSLLRRQTANGGAHRPGALTDREMEIISLLSTGHSVPEIAELLDIGARTVENHKRRIYAKLGVGSSSHAIGRATALGLSEPVLHRQEPRAEIPELTAREHEILRSIARGDTVRQTGRALGIAGKTVENIQARLFRKLGVRNRAGALTAAYGLGLLDPGAVTPPDRTRLPRQRAASF